jgi:hypothetical protein
MQASISTDGFTWIQLGAAVPLSVQLQHPLAHTVHGPFHAPIGSYTRVRLAILNPVVQVNEGSTFGAVTVSNFTSISVSGSGQDLVIEKSLPVLGVQEQGGLGPAVYFDLNAETWLTAESVSSRVVSAATLLQAVTVTSVVP